MPSEQSVDKHMGSFNELSACIAFGGNPLRVKGLKSLDDFDCGTLRWRCTVRQMIELHFAFTLYGSLRCLPATAS
jgi:hypothetical protein